MYFGGTYTLAYYQNHCILFMYQIYLIIDLHGTYKIYLQINSEICGD